MILADVSYGVLPYCVVHGDGGCELGEVLCDGGSRWGVDVIIAC